jgi:hypothetical protein
MPVLSSATSLYLTGGTSGLKVVFFFHLLPLEDIIEVMRETFFSFKRGGEAANEGLWPMREGLGEKFGVVFVFCCGWNGHGALYNKVVKR